MRFRIYRNAARPAVGSIAVASCALTLILASCTPTAVEPQRCNSDLDCAASSSCDDGECVAVTPTAEPEPQPTPEDAGVQPAPDAGSVVPDAGAVDLCGDGVIEGTEECDDDNQQNDDGCSSDCVVEDGAFCVGEPSQCETGVCTIDNTIVAAGQGDADAPCLICIPSSSTTEYSSAPDAFSCDNGNLCDGPDRCSGGQCLPVGEVDVICPEQTPICDVQMQQCVCTDDSCADNLFCNGVESCDAGGCVPGASVPCPPGAACWEEIQGCAECLTGAHCDLGFCDEGVCIATCPEGTHDGGNGICRSIGDCSEGFEFRFTDVDGDLLGGDLISPDCVAEGAVPVVGVAVGGDCNDNDETVGGPVSGFVDEDGDGFTTPGTSCAASQMESPAPTTSFRPYRAFSVGGFLGTLDCDDWGALSRVDGDITLCTTFGEEAGVVFADFGFELHEDAVVVGLTVTATYRSGNGDNDIDTNVVLVRGSNGEVQFSDNRAVGDGAASGFTTTTYGFNDDTWGTQLDPSVINDPTFGIRIDVGDTFGPGRRWDAVIMRVFVAGTDDCDDFEQSDHTAVSLFHDEDDDGFSVNDVAESACIGGSLPLGHHDRFFDFDCDDENQNVFPGQTNYFTSPRQNGSFDYNCDGQSSKKSVNVTTLCACEGDTVCVEVDEENQVPNPGCGQNESHASGCLPPTAMCGVETCEPEIVQRDVRCR